MTQRHPPVSASIVLMLLMHLYSIHTLQTRVRCTALTPPASQHCSSHSCLHLCMSLLCTGPAQSVLNHSSSIRHQSLRPNQCLRSTSQTRCHAGRSHVLLCPTQCVRTCQYTLSHGRLSLLVLSLQ